MCCWPSEFTVCDHGDRLLSDGKGKGRGGATSSVTSQGDPASHRRRWFPGMEPSVSCESGRRSEGPTPSPRAQRDDPQGVRVSEPLLHFLATSGCIRGPGHLGPCLCVSLASVGSITRQILMFRQEGRDSRLFPPLGPLVLQCHLPCDVLVTWRDVHPVLWVFHFKCTLLQSKVTLDLLCRRDPRGASELTGLFSLAQCQLQVLSGNLTWNQSSSLLLCFISAS